MMMVQQHLFPRHKPWRRGETTARVLRRFTFTSTAPTISSLSALSCPPPSSASAATTARFLSSDSQRSTRDHRSMMLSGHTGGGGRRLFTASQWQELEHQALIYKYMATGAPVPHDLVVPLRLASGVDTVPSLALPPHQPTNSLGYWGCYGSAAQLGRKAEDPEPGRCRRTDGKKWRCSREAYGDSKYCEKHIHRGKNRSRKPVEATTTSSAAAYRPSALSISPPAPDAPPTSYHNYLHHGAANSAQAPLQLHLDAGSYSYHAAPSPPPSYHRYAHAQPQHVFPGGYGPSCRELQEAGELWRRERCLALGADLSLDKPPAVVTAAATATEKPLRRFFDEWTGGVDDATQLSMSTPTASPSDLAAASRYHNGE